MISMANSYSIGQFQSIDRWNRRMLALWFAFAAGFVNTVSSPAAEPERLQLEKDFVFLYVKNAETPIYAAPSPDAPVVHRLWKGRQFGSRGILSPDKIDKFGRKSDQLIELKGYPNDVPHGWVRRSDFVSNAEFKRVERWPIKSYRMDWGEEYLYCRFKPDGHTKSKLSSENAKWEDAGYIVSADGMLLSRCGGLSTLLYDENRGIRCPELVPRSTCFTQEEMDAFFKAKADHRQPPKIIYGDGLPH